MSQCTAVHTLLALVAANEGQLCPSLCLVCPFVLYHTLRVASLGDVLLCDTMFSPGAWSLSGAVAKAKDALNKLVKTDDQPPAAEGETRLVPACWAGTFSTLLLLDYRKVLIASVAMH
jgi:hypothetical protein